MAQLVALIVSHDEPFKKQVNRLLRSGTVPVSIVDDRTMREGMAFDVIVVDIRGEAASALAHIECVTVSSHVEGDHTIFVGRVERAATNDGEPLLYFRGRYNRLSEKPA